MAVDTSRYGRRKRDADQALAFQMGSAGDLSAAVRAIDDEVRAQAKLRREQERQAMQDTERRDDRQQEQADRAASATTRAIDVKSRMDDREAKRSTEEAKTRKADTVSRAAALQARQGFISGTELAQLAGKDMTPDELLAAVEGINQEAFDKGEKYRRESSKEDLTSRKTESEIEKNKAMAKKAARGPGPMSDSARRMADAKLRKAEAEAKVAEREASGVVGGKAATKQQALPAEMANQRALKVQGLNLLDRLRAAKAKVGTGPIEGPVADIAGMVISNPERKEFLQLNNAVQRIAGRILEGGKLAEGDARVYEKFILDPNGLDDDEYVNLLDSIQTMLEDDLSAFDQEMTASGRVVGSRKLNRTSGDDEFDSLPD